MFDRKDRTKFRTKQIKPLLDVGYVEMSNPENPTAANQQYIITDKGQHELERAQLIETDILDSNCAPIFAVHGTVKNKAEAQLAMFQFI